MKTLKIASLICLLSAAAPALAEVPKAIVASSATIKPSCREEAEEKVEQSLRQCIVKHAFSGCRQNHGLACPRVSCTYLEDHIPFQCRDVLLEFYLMNSEKAKQLIKTYKEIRPEIDQLTR